MPKNLIEEDAAKKIIVSQDSKKSNKQTSRIRKKLLRVKRRIFKHVWLVRAVLVAVMLAFGFGIILLIRTFIVRSGLDYYLSLGKDFVFTPPEKVLTTNNRTNMLILGKGGADHEAPDLTDSMIFVSVTHPTEKGFLGVNANSRVTMISLPRDIWIPELRAKLNSIYYWGNKKQEGGGLVLTSSVVEEIIGQPIHYSLVVDFSVFKEVIDVLGGIEVEVERPFIDKKYPIPGKENDLCSGDPEYMCRYETIVFESGLQYMDSDRALKYVRSRNAEGDEGTDFARSMRQQRVIKAIIKKLLTKEIWSSSDKITKLFELSQSSLETDLNPSAGAVLARFAFESRDSLSTNLLPEEFLINPPIQERYDNLYVFIPNNNDEHNKWSKVHEWVKCIIEANNCELLIPPNEELDN